MMGRVQTQVLRKSEPCPTNKSGFVQRLVHKPKVREQGKVGGVNAEVTG